jgi:hypothetical protein
MSHITCHSYQKAWVIGKNVPPNVQLLLCKLTGITSHHWKSIKLPASSSTFRLRRGLNGGAVTPSGKADRGDGAQSCRKEESRLQADDLARVTQVTPPDF